MLADQTASEGEPGIPEDNGDPDGEESSEPSEEPDDEESSEPSEEPDEDEVPGTGDTSHVLHWAAVLLGSIMILWIILDGKKSFGDMK